ncbi:hypothetical protein ACILPE_03975 [Capnocytophaga canimorsus]|uniref:hypothetical protein n=1 Tax=Capnocytophaga canimorsus TaxID=28188 RepID=UPI0037CE9543
MKTLLCPIYLSTNVLSDDRFSIGLIMANNDVLFFNYSERKLEKVKHLFSNESYLVIKNYLKTLYRSFYAEDNNILFSKKELLQNWVNKSYLSYLEKYTNNLVQFSKTIQVDIELTEVVFKKYFEMYVFPYPERTENTRKADILKKTQVVNFYEKVQEYVNLDREILSSEIENLLVNTKVNFIGKNNVPTAGNLLNLQNNIQGIENTVSKFISLTKTLDINENTKGQYYLIGEEPDKKLSENHSLWQQLRDTNLVKYVELSEIEQINEYFVSHDVKPYFAF